MGRYLAVLVDATTGWLEAQWCAGPTTAAAIKLLQTSCAQLGLPDTVVSDNGPAFSSDTWLNYVKGLGADPLFSSPYAPYQNGIVERQIQTLKTTLLKITKGTPEVKLLNALAILRFVPSASEGSSAASRLLGWQPAMPVSRLLPHVREPPPDQAPPFLVGDPIFYRIFQKCDTNHVGPLAQSAN